VSDFLLNLGLVLTQILIAIRVDLQGSSAFMNPVELWKKHRRIAHSRLNKQAINVFHAPQQQQAKILLQQLLDASHRLEYSDEVEVELDSYTCSSLSFQRTD
jgi:hypothetical protein